MSRHKHLQLKKRIPPCRRIPPEHGRLTATARQLYDLVFSFGLGGCWMSNRTLASKLDCHKSSVQRSRQLLVHRQLIITARTNPHTWIMWSRYHPAVRECQVLLYPIKQKMDNPWYEIPAFRVGVAKSTLRGSKMLPKLDVANTSALATGEGVAPPTTPLSPSAVSGTTPDEIFTRGAPPPLPPAVQGGGWTKADIRIILQERERIAHLLDYGFTWHEGADRILAERKLEFTTKELFWMDELLELNVNYDVAFNLILAEREKITSEQTGSGD